MRRQTESNVVELFPGQPTRVVTRVSTLRQAGRIALGIAYLLGALVLAGCVVLAAVMVYAAAGPVGLVIGVAVAWLLSGFGRRQ